MSARNRWPAPRSALRSRLSTEAGVVWMRAEEMALARFKYQIDRRACDKIRRPVEVAADAAHLHRAFEPPPRESEPIWPMKETAAPSRAAMAALLAPPPPMVS